VVQYAVTARDVAGPFNRLPGSPYEQAKLDCLCYESAWEQLAERFHTTKQLLARLNPQSDTTRLAAGTTLWVPNVERPHVVPLVSAPKQQNLANATSLAAVARKAGTDSTGLRPAVPTAAPAAATTPGAPRPDSAAARAAPRASTDTTTRLVAQPQVARILISTKGSYLHALDAQGRILAHLPNTLGASYDPSPSEGAFTVTRVVFYPTFHYNPKLYADVPDTRADAMLPAGPNSAVGVVWMALSKPHYGIHGTSAPSSIGYTGSHGCVRLTNWDARWLAEHTAPGTSVEFMP
jgi:lipoprotein-anchoring transpeptidase ErfK/SrfK